MFSYDGIANEQNMTINVPINLYKRHLYINNGNSAFRRVIGKNKNCIVNESLYLNF